MTAAATAASGAAAWVTPRPRQAVATPAAARAANAAGATRTGGSFQECRHRDPAGEHDHAEPEQVAAQTCGQDDDPGVHRRTSVAG